MPQPLKLNNFFTIIIMLIILISIIIITQNNVSVSACEESRQVLLDGYARILSLIKSNGNTLFYLKSLPLRVLLSCLVADGYAVSA
jgi:competence protein ComGC